MFLAFCLCCLMMAFISSMLFSNAEKDIDTTGKLLITAIDNEKVPYSRFFVISTIIVLALGVIVDITHRTFMKLEAYPILVTITLFFLTISTVSYRTLVYLQKKRRYQQIGIPIKYRNRHSWMGAIQIGMLVVLFIILVSNQWK